MNISNLENIQALINKPKALDVLRYLRIYSNGKSVADLSNFLDLPKDIATMYLTEFKDLGCVSISKDNEDEWKLTDLHENVAAMIDKQIKVSDMLFITNRSKEVKIDVVGRLEWIEDAYEMIRYAKSKMQY